MSTKLQQVLRDYITKYGNEGKARLSLAVGRSVGTVDRWLREGTPTAHDAFKLAVAAGENEPDAMAIAQEAHPDTTTKVG